MNVWIIAEYIFPLQYLQKLSIGIFVNDRWKYNLLAKSILPQWIPCNNKLTLDKLSFFLLFKADMVNVRSLVLKELSVNQIPVEIYLSTKLYVVWSMSSERVTKLQ